MQNRAVVVGTAQIDVAIPGARSLKDKRRAIGGVLFKLRARFLVSAAEVADQDLWGNAVFGVAIVSNDPAHIESVMSHIRDFLDSQPQLEIRSFITANEQS